MRATLAAALLAGCTLKATTTPSSTAPSTTGPDSVPVSPPPTVTDTATISTRPTPTTTTTGCGYGSTVVGTLVSAQDVPYDTVGDACLVASPATPAEFCATDREWAAAFGGTCPSLIGFESALVGGADLGWNNELVVLVERWACTDPADGSTSTAYRLYEHCADCGSALVLFDAAHAVAAIDNDWNGTYYYGVCCDGTWVTDTWIGGLPPAGLSCTALPDLDLTTDTGTTGTSGSGG